MRDPISPLLADIHETTVTVGWSLVCGVVGIAGVLLGFCWGAGL